MGFKLFGNSRYKGKSDYYKKIDLMLIHEVTNAYDSVMAIHNDVRLIQMERKKKPKDENWFREELARTLRNFDIATEKLLVDLSPLKTKNREQYTEIEVDIAAIKKDIAEIKEKDYMLYIKELGEMYKKVRNGVSEI